MFDSSQGIISVAVKVELLSLSPELGNIILKVVKSPTVTSSLN